MQKRLALLAAGVLLALGGAWWFGRSSAPVTPAVAPRATLPLNEEPLANAELSDAAARVAAIAAPDAAEQQRSAAASGAPESQPETERTIEVEVVDSAARPIAGVPIALADRSQAGVRDIVADTDAAGVARLRATDAWLARARGPFRLGIALPLAPPIELEYARAALPTERLTLVLPEMSALRIRCRVAEAFTEEQSLQESRPRIELRVAVRAEPYSHLPMPARSDWQAEFTHVQAGVALVIEASLRDWEPESLTVAALAPGEQRELELVFNAPLPIVHARIFGLAGSPLAKEALDVSTLDSGGQGSMSSSTRVSTDTAGRVRLPQQAIGLGKQRRLTFRSTSGDESVSAELPNPLPLVYDLGDLRLRSAPLIAAGIVVDTSGTPLVGVRIGVLIASGPTTWTGAAGIASTSDEHGRFELRGELDAASFRLSPQSEHHAQFEPLATELLTRGVDNVRLVLEGKAGIAGRLLLPEGTPIDACSVYFQRSVGSSQFLTLQRQPNGSFGSEHLPATRGRVVVLIGPSYELIPGVDGLELQLGETLRDPRLDPLDLSDAFTLARFRVENERGEPLNGLLRCAAEAEAQPLAGSWYSVFHGRAVACPMLAGLERVRVTADGYRTQQVELASVPSVVVLRDGWPVVFRIEAFDVPAGAQVALLLRQGNAHTTQVLGAPGSSVEWRAPSTGTWNLECKLVVPSKPFNAHEPLSTALKSIEVGDAPAPAHALHFDPDALAANLERYRR